MINGTLFQEEDNETLEMMLELVSMDKDLYRNKGVIIGEA